VRIARRAVAGVVKPDYEEDEGVEEAEDDAAVEEAPAEVVDEGSETDSEVFVKDDDPESPAPLERR
jgi:hypothetical protein